MDNQRNITSEQNGDTFYSRVEDLQLDRVVASQPELGPTPPDGGYGWVIVIGGFLYNFSVATFLSAYGIFILYAQEDEHDGSAYKIWDQNIALVPLLSVAMHLVLESWCREIVKVFNMPRLMALSGLCTIVAGVLLSSFGTYNDDSNQKIVNTFAGICAGIGSALVSQQTEIIVKHYFRDKLEIVQTVIKLAAPAGACLVPMFASFLCKQYSLERAILVYGIIILQNSIFLAAYTRPIYVVRMIRKTYKMIVEDDDDQEIFSRTNNNKPENADQIQVTNADDNDDERVIATFNTQNTVREVVSPAAVQMRDVKPPTISENRFSSDFSNILSGNRFSSDFTSVAQQNDPEPLYRETTVVNELNDSNFNFAFDQHVTAGTERRTASMQRNFISIMSMFFDPQFYLYTLLHLNTNYSLLMLALFLPCYIHQKMDSYETWLIVMAISIINTASFCFVMICAALPKSLNKKARLCSSFCAIGAVGFYGIALSENRPFLILWGILATFAASSSNILKQPLYDDMINEFDATATSTAANTITALFLLLWTLLLNIEYKTCFETAAILQVITASIFLASSVKINFIRR